MREPAYLAARTLAQEYQRSAGGSFCGSAGPLLLADVAQAIAQAITMAATMTTYATRASLPSIARLP
jgi:hypothetical protein